MNFGLALVIYTNIRIFAIHTGILPPSIVGAVSVIVVNIYTCVRISCLNFSALDTSFRRKSDYSRLVASNFFSFPSR